MELNLDGVNQAKKPPVTKLVVHNQEGESQFLLEYDAVDTTILFKPVTDEKITDELIKSKSTLTTEKGVEAFGSFIAGAEQGTPVYRHLLSLYLPNEDSTFFKYHITIDGTLEHFNLENTLLLAAECYIVMYDPLQEYINTQSISVDNYPLLINFFNRTYQSQAYNMIMSGSDFDDRELSDGQLIASRRDVLELMDRHQQNIENMDLSITTISGAVMGHLAFGSKDLSNTTLHHMTHSSINSPGVYVDNRQVTLWFPFTKNRVGKINRAISTTLNTLSYANTKKDIKEQVQTNIAHKFHDLVEIVGAYQDENNPSLGLQTNVGYLVCAISFKEELQNDLEQILEISQEFSSVVKTYGQAILSYIAKAKKFDTITS